MRGSCVVLQINAAEISACVDKGTSDRVCMGMDIVSKDPHWPKQKFSISLACVYFSPRRGNLKL